MTISAFAWTPRQPSSQVTNPSQSKSPRESADATAATGGRVGRWLLLGVLIICIGAAYAVFRDRLTLEELATQESRLRAYQEVHPWLLYGLAYLFYVAVTGLFLPGATVMTLAYAWYFGFFRGLLLVSLASTSGATVNFLLSRFLFRDWVQARFGANAERFNAALAREGPFFLFTLRLIPAAPFFVINAAMGLTPITIRAFWWISQLGMLPGTIIYVYAGSRVPSLQALSEQGLKAVLTPSQIAQLFAALVLVGLAPLVLRWSLKLFGRDLSSDSESARK